jgi:hypothetical protein
MHSGAVVSGVHWMAAESIAGVHAPDRRAARFSAVQLPCAHDVRVCTSVPSNHA